MLANKEKNVMRTLLTASAATIALIIAAPVAAQRGTGSNHPSGTSMGGPSLSLPSTEGAMPEGGTSGIGTQARLNSQGPAHASSVGIHNASPSSALHTNLTNHPAMDAHHHSLIDDHSPAAHHPGSSHVVDLHTGLTVFNSGGHILGTITHVLTDAHGMITDVLVTAPTGQTYSLPANSFSLSGNMLITSFGV
jgi:hypothetical protein